MSHYLRHLCPHETFRVASIAIRTLFYFRGPTVSPTLVALDPSLTSVMSVYKLFMNCPKLL